MIRILIKFLVLFSYVFGYSQKQEFPQGNEYYHSYEKIGETKYIYDINENLVKEVHASNDFVYIYFNESIFLNYFGEFGFISDEIFSSKKTIDYLMISKEHSDLIVLKQGFIEKYGIDENTGTKKITYSDQNFGNTLPPPIDKNYKLTKEELASIKYAKENKDLIAYQNRLDKTFDEKTKIYTYTQYSQGNKDLELYFKFNEQKLVSNTLCIITSNYNKIKTKYIIYKESNYDFRGNLVELKKFNFKNPKQFDEAITNKSKEEFLESLFKDTLQNFELIPIETYNYTYTNYRLICLETILHRSENTLRKTINKYDSKNRLIETSVFQNDVLFEKNSYKYD
ncbi:hypothetical protein [Cellulophaga sp. L1A9]|uniref:hypothetical protein n=1 Tax=Cellulophaga sp. L1A9 TaxID=2686362 RepID=UPI00131C3053|nr:hypothetical protein [Cellulophaga sp. L1A9]